MRSLLALVVFSLLAATTAKASDPVEFTAGNFSFERPAGWKWMVPSSSMRKAQLQVAGTDGETADVVFFHFGTGQGGSIQDNVDRWFAQFGNSNTSQREELVGGTKVVFVEAAGTFQSGMPGGPTTPLENHALRGAILVDPEGGDVFVKMTGPAGLLPKASAAFEGMVRAAGSKR